MKKCSIILFIKYPELGKVKTRLAKSIGSNLAVNLYKCFVVDILNTLKDINSNLKIFYTPCDKLEKFKRWLQNDYEYICQEGEDLGIRMDNSFKYVFKQGYEKAVIMGSDIPGIKKNEIVNIISKLDNTDAVIGPSDDGGYNLLGINNNKYISKIFKLKSWSHDSVYKNTINIFEKNNIKYSVLDKFEDIDYETDLKRFYKKNINYLNLETIKFINSNKDYFKWIK